MPEFVHVGSALPRAGWISRRRERVPAPPERVWRALVEPPELKRWWCDRVEVDAREGGRYAFGGRHVFGDGRGQGRGASSLERPGDFELLECSPPGRLTYRWWLGDVETRVTWELSNLLELTELTVTQSAERCPAWETDADTPDWWWVALPALRSFVESGSADLRIDFSRLADSRSIRFEVEVYTFPWVIWSKLTDPPELNRWWARRAEVEEKSGVFRLGLEGRGPGRILELEKGRRLLHDWKWPGGACGAVEWVIQETEEATRVSVEDLGPWDSGVRRDFLAIHWAAQLLNLKQMSQRGVTPREYQEPGV